MDDGGQIRMTPETVAAIERWLESNGISLADLQGQSTQHAPRPSFEAPHMQSQGSPKRSDALPPAVLKLLMGQGQTQEHAPRTPYEAPHMTNIGSPVQQGRAPYTPVTNRGASTPYAPGAAKPVPVEDTPKLRSPLGMPGALAFDPTAMRATVEGPNNSPFAAVFGNGDLGGGPPSPDLGPLQNKGSDKDAPFIGPVAPGLPGGVALPEEKKHRGNGNLKAINALMELAANAPVPGGDTGIDIQGIMQDAASAARAPFQAQIKSTRGQNQRAKADTAASSKEIRKMYRALSRSNKRAAERESEQSAATAQSITDMATQTADQLAAQNQARLDQSAAASAALGSGDLNEALSSQINANTAEGARQLTETATNAASTVAATGDAERRYLNRQGQNVKLTGVNRAADLYGDLQDYLQGNRDKISELRGQAAAAAGEAKSAAAASASSAQSDLYEQQYQAHQDMLANQMALLGMKTDLQERNFDHKMAKDEFGLKLQQMLQPDPAEEPLIPGYDNRMIEALPQEQRSALMLQQFLSPESGATLSQLMKNPALSQGFYTSKDGKALPLGGNPLNSQQLLAELGMSGTDPQQNFLLSQIIAQIASGNTDLPYGAQR